MDTVPTLPCKSILISGGLCGFDTAYPDELDGIISQDEFQESMTNINYKYAPLEHCIAACIILIIILSIRFYFLSLVLMKMPTQKNVDNVFIFVTIISLLIPTVIYFIYSLEKDRQLKKVIQKESAKYATRSLIKCTWELIIQQYSQTTSRDVSNIALNNFYFYKKFIGISYQSLP